MQRNGTASRPAERPPDALPLREIVELFSHHARLIALTVLAVLAASLVWLALRPPVFRATAKLLLDTERSAGILGDLALLGRPPAAKSEIEILRSRSIAEATVEAPGTGTGGLGLTTLVDEEGLHPLSSRAGERDARTGRSARPRLRASIDALSSDAPESVQVEFLESARVRLSPTGLAALGLFGPSSRECELAAGEPIEWAGLALRLEPEGDLAGRSFVVRRLDFPDAVARVQDRAHVSETTRNSGVVELAFDDSDPVRAAETANALCRNYLERNVRRGAKRASQTLDFIDGQLEEQTRALDAAELELARLQHEHPRTIDIGLAAESLIGQAGELEVERVRLQLARAALSEALGLLAAGEVEALSRLGPDVADPISTAYVQEIATLSAESELQDRSDTGPFKTLLQTKAAELQAQADALSVEIATQRDVVRALEEGDAAAIARTGADLQGGARDSLSAAYVAELAALAARAREQAGALTPEHPDVQRTQASLRAVQARIAELAHSRLAGLLAQESEYRALLERYEERLAAAPGRERARIADAVARIGARMRRHLESRLAGLASREGDLAGEVARIQSELGGLPQDELALADSRRRLAAHAEIVKLLLSRQQEAQISRAATMATAEWIDTATPPILPRAPSIPLHVAGGILLGLLLGTGLAFLRRSLDEWVVTAAQLEIATSLPVLATIPDFRASRFRLKRAGDRFVALRDQPDGPIAEAYRSLRANLAMAFADLPEAKTLAVVSSSRGEGKSATTINMAMAMAAGGKRVLLVDGDMRRPVVHRVLGLPRSPGLSDVLSGSARLAECVHESGVPTLHVVTAGNLPASPGDLLASDACHALVAEARARYDLILFDLPATLAVADTEGIVSRIDAVVLLCRSREMPTSVVAGTAARLRRAGAALIGCILNAERPQWREWKYGYGYGYGDDSDDRGGAARRNGARERATVGS